MAVAHITLLLVIFTCIKDVQMIFGGTDTFIERQPYMAALIVKNDDADSPWLPLCGASIISTRFLLTSWWCSEAPSLIDEDETWARVGSTAFNSGGQLLKIRQFIRHPDKVEGDKRYDVSIAAFDSGVEIQLGATFPGVAVVALGAAEPPVGSMVEASGWGLAWLDSDQKFINLRRVELRVMAECAAEGATADHMCAGDKADNEFGYGMGDVGGPAVLNGTQYGIMIDWYKEGEIPALFLRISSVREWIRSQTGV